jgi:hypothetical protein
VNKCLWLLLIQGLFGAFDTPYYHEWRAGLPARGPSVRIELLLHAVRTFIYAVIYLAFPRIAWRGLWVMVPLLLLSAEIAITPVDFTIEVETRKPLGGLYDGERITHAVIAIFFGAMLATFIPAVLEGWRFPSTFALIPENDVDPFLRRAFFLMAIGALLSSARDFFAASNLPYSHWPWSIKTLEENDAEG